MSLAVVYSRASLGIAAPQVTVPELGIKNGVKNELNARSKI